MQLDLGTKIRELRRRCGRTQEALAAALGVTSQAVSRWEQGGSCPDVNLLPAIANYFSVTMDELFGFTARREEQLTALLARINEMKHHSNGRNISMDECIALAREALLDHPGNGRVMACLASVLYQAGYVRHGEHHLTDTDGYSVYDVQRHRTYAEWREAIVLYEKALPLLEEPQLRHEASQELAQLYVNTGAYDKAMALAEAAPSLWGCRELLRINACDGKAQARACGEALLATLRTCGELIVSAVLVNQQHLSPAEKAEALQAALRLFHALCPDGHFGEHHAFLGKVQMLRSAFLWLDGQHDEAFAALDDVLVHFNAYETLALKGVCTYTAPLLWLVRADIPHPTASLTASIPEDWPWWSFPEAAAVKAEMCADPRWAAWAAQARA